MHRDHAQGEIYGEAAFAGPVPRRRQPAQGAFDIAFDVKPGHAIYLPPERRISRWQVDRDPACGEKAR